ncbi:MAG: chromate transporter, chromate ion transporter family [Phycisphaerales bacterium]|nr:chromate transporter, chromate ion transporter family [Phycisphaerales bacterium]
MEEPVPPSPPPTALRELAGLFLKLGTIAFGGPAAHIAMMEDEVVGRRKWLTREQFLDMLGATNLIPGPNSTEMAIHVGYVRAGLPGLLVAGASFILPAVVIVLGFAWAYVRFAQLPAVGHILYGVKPVVVAIVLQALWRLGRTAIKTRLLAVIFAIAVVATAFGVNELIVLFAGAAIVALIETKRTPAIPLAWVGPATWPATAPAVATTAAATAIGIGLWPIFFVFLKIGSVLFGRGYVLLAFLRSDLVNRLGWLTENQLLDATAVGQVTPGPLFTTATFIGYVLAGWGGAMAATVGIFLPAFVFVALSAPLLPRLRQSKWAGGFLDGVNVTSLALMAVVTAQLGHSAIIDWKTGLLTVASATLLLVWNVNSTWLVLGGSIAGLMTG